MSTTRKKNNIFKVILSGVTAAVIIAASAGCGTVDLTMGKNNKNSSDNSVVEVIMPAQTTTTVTTTAVTTEVPLPVKSYGDDFVRCNAAICYDLTDGKVIYSKNADKKVFPASTGFKYVVDCRRLKPLQKRDTDGYARSFGERCGIYHSGKCGKEAVRR